jgi:hypothetical protein
VARDSTAAAERRAFARRHYRIPCEFDFEGSRRAGIVTDVSARGLFVGSAHRVPPGTRLALTLRDARGSFSLEGIVQREKRSHRSARQVLSGGFGVRLDVIPEPFFRLLVELGLG